MLSDRHLSSGLGRVAVSRCYPRPHAAAAPGTPDRPGGDRSLCRRAGMAPRHTPPTGRRCARRATVSGAVLDVSRRGRTRLVASGALPDPSGNLADAAIIGRRSDEYLFDIIKHGGAPIGRPGMPAFGATLRDDDIKGLVRYVRGLAGSP